jgi:hypothetical protein
VTFVTIVSRKNAPNVVFIALKVAREAGGGCGSTVVEDVHVAVLITHEDFGVICNVHDLPSSFTMVKEVRRSDGDVTYVVTIFRPYLEKHRSKRMERYVISEELFLTVREGKKYYFQDYDSWTIALQIPDDTYKCFFQPNVHGVYNEYYSNFLYVNKMDLTQLEVFKKKWNFPKTRYKIVSGSSLPQVTVCSSKGRERENEGTFNF